MDPQSIVNFLVGLPKIGQVVVLVVMLIGALPAIITNLVAIWHGIVGAVDALAVIFPGLKSLSDKLKAEQLVIDNESSNILIFLDRLSGIKLPQKPAAPPSA